MKKGLYANIHAKRKRGEKMRKKEHEETALKRALVEAGEGRDLHALNVAIQDAIQYGLKDEELEIATGKRLKLQVYEEVKNKLTAATVSIPKLERGVSEGDVSNLESAIQFAENADMVFGYQEFRKGGLFEKMWEEL